eukprot:jgi/Psemu1/53555/gm1.53555_g
MREIDNDYTASGQPGTIEATGNQPGTIEATGNHRIEAGTFEASGNHRSNREPSNRSNWERQFVCTGNNRSNHNRERSKQPGTSQQRQALHPNRFSSTIPYDSTPIDTQQIVGIKSLLLLLHRRSTNLAPPPPPPANESGKRYSSTGKRQRIRETLLLHRQAATNQGNATPPPASGNESGKRHSSTGKLQATTNQRNGPTTTNQRNAPPPPPGIAPPPPPGIHQPRSSSTNSAATNCRYRIAPNPPPVIAPPPPPAIHQTCSSSTGKRQRIVGTPSANRFVLVILQRQFVLATMKPTTTNGKQLSARGSRQKANRKHERRHKQRKSSNFLTIAAPVSKSHETYKQLSQIKPERKRVNKPIDKPVKTIALKNKYQSTVVAGKYMETNWWGGKIGGKKKYEPELALSIDNFETLDSTKDEHILAFDDYKPSLRIFAKVSRGLAERHLASKNNINLLREFAPAIVGAKPTIGRGVKRGSINDDYAIIGIRPERLDSNNGEYVFKSHVDPSMKLELEEKTVEIVKHMHHSLIDVEPFVAKEMDVLSQILSRTKLNAIGCHVDDDMYYTRLTVIAPAEVSADEVIYYFVFPTYGVKVPLRSGDTLLFNPLVLHSCSNPKFEGCYIMSAYVSRKTVLRANPL